MAPPLLPPSIILAGTHGSTNLEGLSSHAAAVSKEALAIVELAHFVEA